MKEFILEKDFSCIKLIIWDLDNTIWQGVLSEGGVLLNPVVPKLLEKLTRFGIINSICSKNDEEQALAKLAEYGLSDFFVFNSINWQNKGQRVKAMISRMNLKERNVLFIDDEPSNLEEVSFYCPGIFASLPGVIKDLYDAVPSVDTPSGRLAEYKILEKKKHDEDGFDSPIEFLRQSEIKISISKDCWKNRKRAFEIVQRTNQLNFTKSRPSEKEFFAQLKNKQIECGLIRCLDKYGYYGIVGFYALKDGTLLHFSFSCRCLGMGIEQFVYSFLGFPHLTVVGDTAVKLDASSTPTWIELVDGGLTDSPSKERGPRFKTIFKGPCDMEQMFSFIRDDKSFSKEFNYVSRTKKCTIYQGTHSATMVQIAEKNIWIDTIKNLPFYDCGAFDTKLFTQKNGLIFISLIPEGCYALYKHKRDQFYVVLGEWCVDLCNDKVAKAFNEGKLFNGGFHFSDEDYKKFKDQFVYEGRITPEQVCKNYELILNHIDKSNDVYFFLPSEMSVPTAQRSYKGREEYHKELNKMFMDCFSSMENVRFIRLTDFASNLSCYTNNLNHFQKNAYFELARYVSSIYEKRGSTISGTNALERLIRKIRKKLRHE